MTHTPKKCVGCFVYTPKITYLYAANTNKRPPNFVHWTRSGSMQLTADSSAVNKLSKVGELFVIIKRLK